MDPSEKLIVRFHFGGKFVRIGLELDYVGGDEEISQIERDKLSLPEITGHLGDHITYKDAMKLYFLLPGKELSDGLMFLFDDAGCMKMSEYTTDDGVADVYVEYFGEQDEESEKSGSDFEDEIHNEEEGDNEEAPDAIISVDEQVDFTAPNVNGLTSVIASPVRRTIKETFTFQDGQSSQVTHAMTGSSQVLNPGSESTKTALIKETVQQPSVPEREERNSESERDSDSSSEDSDYVADSDDSGLEEEYVELKEEAKAFKKRIRDSKEWAHKNPTDVVPIDLVANVEEVIGEDHFDSDDEDYSYDEDSDHDGHVVRRKSKYPRYNPKADIPMFCLGMVFRSKEQMRKALIKYGLLTFRSIIFMKSEEDRIRAKCGWPGCPWLIYGAKTTRCSRFQVLTFESEHECAPNRDNHLVTAKVIARRYEHILRANPTWKIDSIKKVYEYCLEPVEGEERWPISDKPRPQAPGYVSMPGRPRKNDRKREEGEAPKGKKMSKHGTKITCSMCGHKGHNKTGCKKNPEKGQKKNAFLKKTGKKIKATEQANTDAQIRASQQAKSKEIYQAEAEAGPSGGKRKATRKKHVHAKKKSKN